MDRRCEYGQACRRTGHQRLATIGVAVGQMSILPCTFYTGDVFDNTVAVLVANDRDHLSAVWAFCTSAEYRDCGSADQPEVQCDQCHSASRFPLTSPTGSRSRRRSIPNGLPEPESDDPTQWLFHGRPEASTAPLQVAVARLLGYRWPAELAPRLQREMGRPMPEQRARRWSSGAMNC